jgi:hypothetical protein
MNVCEIDLNNYSIYNRYVTKKKQTNKNTLTKKQNKDV